jgi:glycosyltransferase involved in cell wall biosynthesis
MKTALAVPFEVTVIIPTRQRHNLLQEALASVTSQTLPAKAVVVVADGPDEAEERGVREAISGFGAVPLKLICQGKQGASVARNAGIAVAQTEWVAFLDDDDRWRPGHLQRVAVLAERHPEASLLFCGIDSFDSQTEMLTPRDDGLGDRFVSGQLESPLLQFLSHMPLQTSAVVARRSVMVELAGFSQHYEVGEDWDLWYRIAEKHSVAYDRTRTVEFRAHAGNTPKDSWRAFCDCIAVHTALRARNHDCPEVTAAAGRIIERILDELLRKAVKCGWDCPDEIVQMIKGRPKPWPMCYRAACLSRYLPGGLLKSGCNWISRVRRWCRGERNQVGLGN